MGLLGVELICPAPFAVRPAPGDPEPHRFIVYPLYYTKTVTATNFKLNPTFDSTL
jgi:hypothetical protein